LQVGQRGLTVGESRAQFSLWAILAAPLIATNDLRSLTPEIHEMLLNREVIAVDQDPAGIQGTRVRVEGDREVWMRPLSDGSRAVVLFNRGKSSATIRVRWTDIGRKQSDGLEVRDLWKHQNQGSVKAGYSARVPSHGVVMIRVGASAK
jgi:alpha-galactosidase